MFTYSGDDLPYEWATETDGEAKPETKLTVLLKSKWNEIHNDTNVFRYKLGKLKERIIDKKTKYFVQLNPDRGTKRRHPDEIEGITQPFDPNKFNFTKINSQEKLFDIVDKENEREHHQLLVNVSPITRYHSLLCPSVDKCLPQIVTRDSLKLVIDIMFLSQDRDLRIGFNSLCAMASVNHLHYHLLNEKNDLPAEIVKCNHLKGPLYRFEDSYPAPAFCFQIKNKISIAQVTDDVYKLVRNLLDRNIPHNIMITRGHGMGWDGPEEAIRVVVWPRTASCGIKVFTAFNVAVCELSGWFPVYSNDDYECLQSEDIEIELKKWKLHNFNELCNEIKLLY